MINDIVIKRFSVKANTQCGFHGVCRIYPVTLTCLSRAAYRQGKDIYDKMTRLDQDTIENPANFSPISNLVSHNGGWLGIARNLMLWYNYNS